QRREFVSLLGGGAKAWPSRRAPSNRCCRCSGGSAASRGHPYHAAPFRHDLKEAGYIEGQNLTIEYRFANSQYDQLPMLAADLLRRQVAVIASGGIVAAIAAKSATTTISIVIQIGDNPVRLGLFVGSSRRGGNITGVTSLNVEVVPKLL